jgi:3-methylcrotonyl-CoA carboxylase alpha subunit
VIKRLRCGDDLHQVALRETQHGLQVLVDGAAFRLEVQQIAAGTFCLRQGQHVETFHCVRDGGAVHLFWRGTIYTLFEEGEGRRLGRQAAGGLEAPMPGKVIKVSVAPGEDVKRGAEILVIEAMKMENAVRAPRDGRVKSVAAKAGDMVGPGSVLVELE